MGDCVLQVGVSIERSFIIGNEYQTLKSHDLPGDLGSFSVSLLCVEPIGEPDMVGERKVGDFGVAIPINKTNVRISRKYSWERLY